MQEKEKRILEAAAKLFARFGPKKTTIDDIAKDAGIAKGTVYLYFKSKEDIFQTVARRETASLLDQMRTAVRREPKALGKLKKFLRTRMSFNHDFVQRLGVSLEVLMEARLLPEGKAVVQEYLLTERQLVKDILVLGVEQGDFMVDDMERLTLAFSLILEGLDQPWSVSGQSLKLEEKVDLFLELVLKGILPR